MGFMKFSFFSFSALALNFSFFLIHAAVVILSKESPLKRQIARTWFLLFFHRTTIALCVKLNEFKCTQSTTKVRRAVLTKSNDRNWIRIGNRSCLKEKCAPRTTWKRRNGGMAFFAFLLFAYSGIYKYIESRQHIIMPSNFFVRRYSCVSFFVRPLSCCRRGLSLFLSFNIIWFVFRAFCNYYWRMDHLLLRHNLIQSYVRDISLNLSNLCTFGCFLVFFSAVGVIYVSDGPYVRIACFGWLWGIFTYFSSFSPS